jgi:hypothetical protein
MATLGRVARLAGWWSWVADGRGEERQVKQVHLLRREGNPVALLAVPLPFGGHEAEHGEIELRWTPVLLGGYVALALSGAVDPLEASVAAWLTPLGENEWHLMRGACLPDLGLRDGTLVRFPGVPWAAPSWPRRAGERGTGPLDRQEAQVS